MKQRPILFSAPMVQAILAGRKTQTRRFAKHVQDLKIESYEREGKLFTSWSVKFEPAFRKIRASHSGGLLTKEETLRFISNEFCPYGPVGDQLWVRETFLLGRIDEWDAEHPDDRYLFIDQCEDSSNYPIYKQYCLANDVRIDDVTWKPSIHMPRAASRILLEITDVRIERLQDISEEDCWAEGIDALDGHFDDMDIYRMAKAIGMTAHDAKPTYAVLWESINGADSWSANPWVWVISFRVVQGGDL